MSKLFRIFAACVVVVSLLLTAPVVFAAPSATLSLSPASETEAIGGNFSVNIYENSGAEPVNGVSLHLSYPANLLSFVGVSSSSAFSVVVNNSGSGGSISIGRGALPSVTGNQLVASVSFNAIASSGTAGVAFSGSDDVISAKNNTNILTGTSGANFILKPSAKSAPTVTPTSAAATKGTITGITLSDVGTNSATVSWTTSEPATSEVDYGLNNGYGFAASDNNFVTSHKLALNSSLLNPGVEYHFVVKSADPSNNSSKSQDQTFTTKGATLIVTVVNQKKKPVSQAQVAIGGSSATTDKNGQATLTGLQIGKTVAQVTYKGHKTPLNIQVNSIVNTNTPQAITLTIQTANSHLLIILLPLLALAAVVGLVFVERNKIKNFKTKLPPPPTAGGKSGDDSGQQHNVSNPAPKPSEEHPPTIVRPTIPPR